KDNPFDVGGVPPEAAAVVPSPAAPAAEPSARSPFAIFEFTSIRISDRGAPRALSTSGKYARFGFPLASWMNISSALN
ncbi:MAG: hypothetical protein J7551_03735, partial [Chloroflexi bacterium]|nr:hypothetical protein [Chloroflexota bacterium]